MESYLTIIHKFHAFVCAQVMNLAPHGLLHSAPPCGSWIYLARGSTGRSVQNAAGWVWRRSVLRTNILVERLCYALRLAHSLGAYWSVEQPSSSATSTQILQMHFRFLRFLASPVHTQLRCCGTTPQCGQPSEPVALKKYPSGCAVMGPRVLNRLRHLAALTLSSI